MQNKIHPTAIIDSSAIIADNVEIGPYTIIGPHVEIGKDTWIGPHVVINGPTKIGTGNKIYQFASVGEDPQDLSHKDEVTSLEIGDYNVIREFVTIHRGTIKDKGLTKIGSHNLIMAYAHIAHDCVIHDHIIFLNNASLAGHVIVENYAIIGAFSAIHQFVRVGAYSFSARACQIPHDVPPYFLIVGHDSRVMGINKVGLQRRGISKESILQLFKAYKTLYRESHTISEALKILLEIEVPFHELTTLINFVKKSQEEGRGILKLAGKAQE